MNAQKLLQRRKSHATGPGISLFPFLAVLICTMGALVPLLLAISRTARLQAEAEARAQLAQRSVGVQTKIEDARWRIEQLKQSRTQTESQLADARLALGHIEDHSRRLRNQLEQYERTLGDLENAEKNGNEHVIQSKAELEDIRTKIASSRQKLANAEQSASGRNNCYAIVPYEGPNQTHRRPIYIECRADAVVLQPEGIALTESDFDGPLGPGNPLAMALRAAREYMLSQRNFDPEAGEPYPMLLVRPEGINAYYAARAAMKSWGFEFGYELISDDWKLAYPPADPRLADAVKQVIETARVNQARLIAAAPREYNKKRSKVVYRASPTGGFIAEHVASNDDDDYGSVEERGEGGEERGERRGGGGGNGAYPAGVTPPTTGSPFAGSGSAGGSSSPLAASQPYGNASTPANGPALTTGNGYGVPSIGGSSYAGSGSGGYAPGTNPGSSLAASQPYGNASTSIDGPALTAGNGYGAPSVGGSSSVGSGSGGYVTNANSGSPLAASQPYGNASAPADGPATTAGNGYGAPSVGGPPSAGSSGSDHPLRSSSGDTAGSGSNGYAPSANSGSTLGASQPYGNASGVPSQGGYPGTSASSSSPTASSGSSGTAGAKPAERPEGYVVGQPPHEQPKPSAPSKSELCETMPADGPRSYGLRPGEWQPKPEPPPKMPDEKKKDDDSDKKRPPKSRENLADKRGADWALRDAARGSVGIARPIRVECHADRLVVLSENSLAGSKVIPLGPRTVSSIDTIIACVWERMESWGIAGRGMYWRPILQVVVVPGGEQRFADLSALLDQSGIVVERKK